MNIYQILDKNCIDHAIKARTKREVIEQIADLMARSGKVPDKNVLLNALLEREKLCSTGVGEGVAIPHAKCEGMTEICVALAVAKEGVNFEAVDKKPVKVIFGLSGPPGRPEEHIRILSRVSRLLRDPEVRNALIRAGNADEMFKTLVEEETRRAYPEEEAKEHVWRENKLLILVLYDEDLLDEIMEYLLELGIGAGVVVEGTTLVDAASRKIPLFAGFGGVGGRTRGYATTILGVVSADMMNTVASGLERITGELDTTDKVMLFALDVERVKSSIRVRTQQ